MTAFVWTMLFLTSLSVAADLDDLRTGSERPLLTAVSVAGGIALIVWASILLWEAHK